MTAAPVAAAASLRTRVTGGSSDGMCAGAIVQTYRGMVGYAVASDLHLGFLYAPSRVLVPGALLPRGSAEPVTHVPTRSPIGSVPLPSLPDEIVRSERDADPVVIAVPVRECTTVPASGAAKALPAPTGTGNRLRRQQP